jgi:hypothetical protein
VLNVKGLAGDSFASRLLTLHLYLPFYERDKRLVRRSSIQKREVSEMRITNVVGTSGESCSCASWLAHWEKEAGQKLTYCPVMACMKKDLCGAHVRKAGDSTVYILPLCSAHNQSTEVLDVPDSYTLVPAKVATCEKSYPVFRYTR